MRTTLSLLALATVGFATPAQADHHTEVNAEVVARDASGRATQVRVDGRVYNVCTPRMQDNCINPREAGLNFGNVPLDRWPGQPASQRRRN